MSKKNKKRFCPALQRGIASSECGQGRHQTIVCPPDCPFSPFSVANYDQLLELEDAVDARTLQFLGRQKTEDRPNLTERDYQNGDVVHAKVVAALFLKKDRDGMSLVERWLRSADSDLKSDEKTLLAAKARTRVALVEVRRVVDDRQIEVADLLAPGEPRLLLVDRSLASSTVRFATMLLWIYPTPHFHRVSGVGLGLAVFGDWDAVSTLRSYIRHLGGPEDLSILGLWLENNISRLREAMTAVAGERHEAALRKTNLDLHVLRYRASLTPAECERRLASQPDVFPDSPAQDSSMQTSVAFVVLDEPRSVYGATPQRRLVGEIRLEGGELVLEARSENDKERLVSVLEKTFGTSVSLVSQTSEDLRHRLSKRFPNYDAKLAPPELCADVTGFELASYSVPKSDLDETPESYGNNFMMESAKAWLDRPIPALNGQTPMQAAKGGDPELRRKLERMVKGYIKSHDERNLREGLALDINWLPKALGLDALDQPPPPFREPLSEDEDELEDMIDGLDYPYGVNPWALERLDYEKTRGHVLEWIAEFEGPEEVVDHLESLGVLFDVELGALFGEGLPSEDSQLMQSAMQAVWFYHFPKESCGLPVDAPTLRDMMGDFEKLTQGDPERALRDEPDRFCANPELLRVIMEHLLEANLAMPAPKRLVGARWARLVSFVPTFINYIHYCVEATENDGVP